MDLAGPGRRVPAWRNTFANLGAGAVSARNGPGRVRETRPSLAEHLRQFGHGGCFWPQRTWPGLGDASQLSGTLSPVWAQGLFLGATDPAGPGRRVPAWRNTFANLGAGAVSARNGPGRVRETRPSLAEHLRQFGHGGCFWPQRTWPGLGDASQLSGTLSPVWAQGLFLGATDPAGPARRVPAARNTFASLGTGAVSWRNGPGLARPVPFPPSAAPFSHVSGGRVAGRQRVPQQPEGACGAFSMHLRGRPGRNAPGSSRLEADALVRAWSAGPVPAYGSLSALLTSARRPLPPARLAVAASPRSCGCGKRRHTTCNRCRKSADRPPKSAPL